MFKVVDILLLQTVSIVVASAGVFVAAIYYVLQIRHQSRMRQTEIETRQADLLMRMHLAFSSKEYSEAALKILSTDYKDYDDFLKKYGHPFAAGQVQTEFLMMGMFFEGIGVLTKRKLANIALVNDLFAVEWFWEKVKPLAEGLRKQLNNPHVYEWFEYLANEEKKHHQQLASKAA